MVVEKTCATSLRVEFVRAVLPDAKYVFITRDGLDAAASAMERWHAPLDLRYTAAKARFVPAERPALLRRPIRRAGLARVAADARPETRWPLVGSAADDFRG